MDNFIVNITIVDCVSSKCCNSSKETTKIISNTADFFSLQNNYYVKIKQVTTYYVILDITNGAVHYIRKAFLNIPFNLSLSENCPMQKISINVNSIVIR